MVVFPPVHRHRYFRLKRRLPALAAAALRNSAAALGVALAADLALGAGRLSVTLAGGLAAWLAASLCCFCWLLGGWCGVGCWRADCAAYTACLRQACLPMHPAMRQNFCTS